MSPHVSWGVEGHSFSQLRRSDGRIQKGTWEGIDLSVPNLEGGAFCFKYGKRRLWASWWGCPGCVTPYVCARLCDTVCVWERMCDTVCVCQAVWHGVCVCVCVCVYEAVWHNLCVLGCVTVCATQNLPPPPTSTPNFILLCWKVGCSCQRRADRGSGQLRACAALSCSGNSRQRSAWVLCWHLVNLLPTRAFFPVGFFTGEIKAIF